MTSCEGGVYILNAGGNIFPKGKSSNYKTNHCKSVSVYKHYQKCLHKITVIETLHFPFRPALLMGPYIHCVCILICHVPTIYANFAFELHADTTVKCFVIIYCCTLWDCYRQVTSCIHMRCELNAIREIIYGKLLW